MHDPTKPIEKATIGDLESALKISDVVAAVSDKTRTLEPSPLRKVAAHPLWIAIHERGDAIQFAKYDAFIKSIFGCQNPTNPAEWIPADPCTCSPDEVACRNQAGKGGPVSSSTWCYPARKNFAQDRDALGHLVNGTSAYQLLKTATEVFLLLESGIAIQPERNGYGRHGPPTDALSPELSRINDDYPAGVDPPQTYQRAAELLAAYLGDANNNYLMTILRNAYPGDRAVNLKALCEGVLCRRANSPTLIELIWSYWHEEGMLVQTMSKIALRFQNRRAPGKQIDPLAELEIDPLRPLGNLLWGYIQDEHNRLTVPRRSYEYEHHYGLQLVGDAVPEMRPADRRARFLEAFHHLLQRAAQFYIEDADTTVVSDGFPLFNALKELHVILAQGAHNQYGDLPWTARVEMLMQQWLLARPEMKDFLRGRDMVPYPEGWMPRVEAMQKVQGWPDISVISFHDLGVYGERLLLSVRYGNWIKMEDQEHARTWARYWKPEVQGYIHAYRAVTGVDLTLPTRVDATLPGVLLRKRFTDARRQRLAARA